MDYNRLTIETLKEAFKLLAVGENPTELINDAVLKLEIATDNLASENKPYEHIKCCIEDMNYIKECYGCTEPH